MLPNGNTILITGGSQGTGQALAQRWHDKGNNVIVTNLLGPLRMTNALIGHLKGRPGAAVVNVSSGLAFMPLPATPTYSATKAALHSYTASLRAHLAGLTPTRSWRCWSSGQRRPRSASSRSSYSATRRPRDASTPSWRC